MRPLFQRQHKYYFTWFHQTLSLAVTLLPPEYFPTRLKACNYCMQELQRVACNNYTWNHDIKRIDCTRERDAVYSRQWNECGGELLELCLAGRELVALTRVNSLICRRFGRVASWLIDSRHAPPLPYTTVQRRRLCDFDSEWPNTHFALFCYELLALANLDF